ncbi:hypothetical protein ACU4GR_24105 [Methylobacterium oryzae CBMB20]
MAKDRRNADILHSISTALGVEGGTLLEEHVNENDVAEEYHRAVLLARLIRAFNALPDDHTRLDALCRLERLATQAS